jgi:hypothetical protein
VTTPGAAGKIVQGKSRRAHFVLRNGDAVDGDLYLNEGQALAPYLGSRKGGWVNIIRAHWPSLGETANHAVLQADHIFYCASVDRDIPVYGATAQPTLRETDLSLEDGTTIRGTLHLAEKQRLSDYLTSCGKFLPVLGAKRLPNNQELGDVAVNAACVRLVKDAKVFAPGAMDPIADPEIEARVSVAIPAIATGTPALAVKEPVTLDLTPAEREMAAWLSRHWLVQLATAGAQLAPPDPRALPHEPTLDDVWHGLAVRNDLADGELAVHVAAAFRLGVANLDAVKAEALAVIPEKVARKLGVLPIAVEGNVLVLAVSDPSSMEIEQQVGFVTKLRLRFEVAPPAEIRGALDWHYGAPAA